MLKIVKAREQIYTVWTITVYLRTFTYIWINQQQYVSVCNLFAYENLNIIWQSFNIRYCATGYVFVVGWWCAFWMRSGARCCQHFVGIQSSLIPLPLSSCIAKVFIQVPSNIRFSSVNWTLHRNHKFIEINLITSMPDLSLSLYLYCKCILYRLLLYKFWKHQQCTTARTHTGTLFSQHSSGLCAQLILYNYHQP